MIIGIIGLGLIGGSLALATKKYTSHTVFGFDKDKDSLALAFEKKAIDEELTDDKIKLCDMLVVALTPKLACEYFKKVVDKMKDGATLSDITGVKSDVVNVLQDLAQNHPQLNFISTHPMAGREVGGMVNALNDLFVGGYTVIVDVKSDEKATTLVSDYHKSLGVKDVVFTTPERHDKMIAYTSQLAHIVSASYIKNPLSQNHKGFSAGSFQDMTRVARLNPKMWTELCLENKENLSEQLTLLIAELSKFEQALKSNDDKQLYELFEQALQKKLLSEKN